MASNQSNDNVEVLFPLAGTDAAGEYGVQRPNTTIKSKNIRSLDPILERLRGGSRHGLIAYPDDQLPNTSSGDINFTIPTVDTWTSPASGVMLIEAWGGGGSPAFGDSGGGAVGGGGGEYARLNAFAISAGTVYNYTVGHGNLPFGSDGEDTTFNGTSLIAKGGKADGTGGTGGTGDVLHAGGHGGASGVDIGGGGGGGGGSSTAAGGVGSDGAASNFGGSGAAATGDGGAGGDGATGFAGSETAPVAGTQPGGGGGGGAYQSGAVDPAYTDSAPGGDGKLHLFYNIQNPIQHLAQLVIIDPDNLNSSFENYSPDFIPDPSTNNRSTRNPGRQIPPYGSGSAVNRNRPRPARDRIQVVPNQTSQFDGGSVLLTVTLTMLPASSAVSGLVTLLTFPSGHSGDRTQMTTNGAGTGTFSVSESTYEGTIVYVVLHEYNDPISGKKLTCSGITKVSWQPNYTLRFSAPYSRIQLEPLAALSTTALANFFADPANKFVATLTKTGDGSPIVGRTLVLTQAYDLYDLSCAYVNTFNTIYNGTRAVTDVHGQARFKWNLGATTKQVVNAHVRMIGKNGVGSTGLTSSTATLTIYTEFCS